MLLRTSHLVLASMSLLAACTSDIVDRRGRGGGDTEAASSSGATGAGASPSTSTGGPSTNASSASGEQGGGGSGGNGTGSSGSGGFADDAWVHRFVSGPEETEVPSAMALHPAGGVVVTGMFHHSLTDAGPEDLEASLSDAFVSRLSDDGTVLWSRALGAPFGFGVGVEVDPAGDVYLLARSSGAFTFGSSTVSGDDVEETPVLAKLSADGTPLWATAIGGPGEGSAWGFGLGPSAEPLVTVVFDGTTTVAGHDLAATHTSSYVASFSPVEGAVSWVTLLASNDEFAGDQVLAKDVVARGNGIAVVGSFEGVFSLAGATYDSGFFETDAFALTLDPATGEPSNLRAWGSADGGESFDAAAGLADGSLVLAGALPELGQLDFGGGPITSSARLDAFVARLDADDQLVWQGRYGADGDQLVYSVAIDPAGYVSLSGSFDGSLDLGGSTFVSTSDDFNYNGYFARFAPDGGHVESWALQSPGAFGTGACYGSRLYGFGTLIGTATIAGIDVTSNDIYQDVIVIGFPSPL